MITSRPGRPHAGLLVIHVVGAVCWIAAVVALACLEFVSVLPTVVMVPRVSGVATAARWALTPCAAAVLLSGFELARRWRHRWPRVVSVQLGLALVVLGLTGVITMLDPRWAVPVRAAQIVFLVAAFVIATAWRPGAETATADPPRRTGGRHRAR